MSSHVTDQAQYQFIGNVTYNSQTTISALPAGAIAVIDMDGAVQTSALTSTAYYMIVQKKADGTVLKSPVFLASDIISGSKNQTAYSVPKNQVTYLGVSTASGNAVTGLGTHTAGDIYKVGVGIKNWGAVTTSDTYRDFAYEAVTGDSDKTVSGGLFDSAYRVLKRNAPYPAVRVDVIADVASIAAFTGTGYIYKFTKDSTSVAAYVKDADGTTGMTASTMSSTAADVVAIASTNGRSFTFTAVALGSGAGRHIVWIGETAYNVADAGTAAQNATAIAAAINAGTQAYASASTTTVTITYRNDKYYAPPMVISSDDDSTYAIVAVTIASGESKENIYHTTATVSAGASIVLDRPWQGETCYLYESTGTTTTATCGIGTLSASKYGLKFSGLAPETFDPVNDNPSPVSFVVEPYKNGAATTFETTVNVVNYQAVYEGIGTYKQVAKKEVWDQFQNKGTNLQTFPRTSYKLEANADKVYNLLEFRVQEQLDTIYPGSNVKTFMSIELAVDQTLVASDVATLATVFGL